MLTTLRKIKENLHKDVEELVSTKNCSYIDAVILYCEKNGLDVEHIGAIISNDKILSARIQLEAEELNMVEKTTRLPV